MDQGEDPCSIFKLPETIIIEVFLNLTVSSLLHCRRVCKPWRHLLSSPLFAQCLEARGAPPTVALCKSKNQFFLLQGEDLTLIATSCSNEGSNSSKPSHLHFINSCNALVCMSWCSRKACSQSFPCCRGEIILIVNPLSGEFIALPRASKHKVMNFCGFGFCPETNQFKVLRIIADREDETFSDYSLDSDEEPLTEKEILKMEMVDYSLDSDDEWRCSGSGPYDLDDYDDFDDFTRWKSDSDDNLTSNHFQLYDNLVVEVYTLGTGAWRKIEVENGLLDDVGIYADECYSFSYANGRLYWIQDTGGCNVASFNFRTERFQTVTTEDDEGEPILGIGAFKGYPCLCRLEERKYIESEDSEGEYVERLNNGMKVLVLNSRKSKKKSKKKSKQPWTSLSVVRFPKDFSIYEGSVRVIKYFENGDVLLRKGYCGERSLQPAGLYMFNKKKQSVERIPDYKIDSPDDVVVFTPTFISLKDVVKGESSSVHKLGFAKVLKGKAVRSQG